MPQQLYPWGKCASTHRIGDWVDPRAGLDTVVERKIPASAENQTLFVQPMT